MSEFIELGKVVKSLSKSVRSTTVANYVLAKAIQVIATLPTIEIVRCKDCMWWNECRTKDKFPFKKDSCNKFGIKTIADDFCSRGERTE